MPLNFGGQKRSGAFDMVWPPANIWNQGKKWQSLEQCTEHMILKRMTQKPPGQTESGSSRQKSKRMASIGMPHRSHQNIQRVAVQPKIATLL